MEHSDGSAVGAGPDPATSTGWPSVEYEDHEWVSSVDIPRRWQSTYSGPYRAAVVPEIASLDPVMSAATSALAASCGTTTAKATRPNILMITVDNLGFFAAKFGICNNVSIRLISVTNSDPAFLDQCISYCCRLKIL